MSDVLEIMVDLETLGTRPGCKVLSIGAVAFGPSGLGSEFYITIDRDTQFGLHEDPDTLLWWDRQKAEAKRELFAHDPRRPTLSVALMDFSNWLRRVAHDTTREGLPAVAVWGNGADFDNAILAAAYHTASLPQPWGPYAGRCYRTLKNLRRDIPFQRQGTYHNALHDAKSQAEHAVRLFEALGLWRLGAE